MKKNTNRQSFWQAHPILLFICTLGIAFLAVYLAAIFARMGQQQKEITNTSELNISVSLNDYQTYENFFGKEAPQTNAFKEIVAKNKKAIEDNIFKTISHKTLKETLPLGIEIKDRDDTFVEEGGYEGAYFPSLHKIFLRLHPNPDDIHVQHTLKNELFSAAISQTNEKKGCEFRDFQIGLPYYNEKCEFDPQLFEQVKFSVEEFDGNVQKFEQNPKSNEFSQAILSYQPKIYYITDYASNLKSISFKSNLPGIIHIIPAEKSGYSTPGYIYKIEALDNYARPKKIAAYTFAADDSKEEKTKAFFADHKKYLARYKVLEVYQRDEQHYYSERASDIAELEPKVKRIFAPSFCRFFEAYHDDSDYCSDLPTEHLGHH